MNYKVYFTLIFTALTFIGKAQVETRTYYADEGLVPREHPVDMQNLSLELDLFPEEKRVKGTANFLFKVLQKEVDSLFLDAIKMDFSSVLLNGKELKYKKSNAGITLYFSPALSWNSTHNLAIQYQANPRKGIYFIGWDDASDRCRKQIWTQGQGIDNRHWIPLYDDKDDKLISEIKLNFDSKFQVLSNGKKIAEKKGKYGKTFWHYRISHPHAPYLVMLGIGEYDIARLKSASGVPLNLYYYPGEKEEQAATYKFSKRMFDFFEKEIGVPYPWETYSQIPVQDFMYGAMENTTATIFGDFYLVDNRAYLDKNYVRVDAHELAHQWFGDMITARASAHHWLQESFATHYDMMYQKEAFGQDHFDWVRRDYNDQSIAESKSNLKPLAHSSAGTVRHYPKGAFVLEMLKYVIGREQFNAGIKYYLEKHAYGNVNSQDLLIAFHERLGLSLNWFWEDWVYRGGEPKYAVQFEESEGIARFQVKQVHEQNELVDLFRMPIVFQIRLKNGELLEKKVMLEKEFQEVQFKLPEGSEVAYPLFDPNSQIMKEINFPKSKEYLIEQAKNAEFMLDRFDAVVALGKLDFEGKEAFLLDRFAAESFHGIKAEIITQLMPALDNFSTFIAKAGLEDKDPKVRKAVLQSTVRISDELEPYYRKCLSDSSYNNIVLALDLLSFYHSDKINDYLALTKAEVGGRSHQVRVKYLLLDVMHNNNEEAWNELVDLSSNSYEFLTRVNAAEAMKTLNRLDEKALANLTDALFSFNSRLRGPVAEVLDYFFEQRAHKAMMVDYLSQQTWTDQEFKRVKKYLIL